MAQELRGLGFVLRAAAASLLLVAQSSERAAGQQPSFHVEEATIREVHRAIQERQTTCRNVVQEYIDRAKAYNGVCTALVTKDGKPIPPATGVVRAGAPIVFPSKTVSASTVLPDLDRYEGLPINFGRMEPTKSDPAVQQQFGMRVGIPEAGQLNALETLNIRGERSVTCKGEFDRAPSAGPLPAGAPAVCEEFRKQPDALERASELDRQYGNKPDLAQLPMYCVVFSLKDWYDAKDMRSTGGNDVAYAMDVPKADSPDVANLRAKGAIIYAVTTAAVSSVGAEGPSKPKTYLPTATNLQDAPWSGQPCNPYDTERVPRGTSNGSAISVSANLAACGICEQTAGSCKGPASRNNVVNFVATKGVMMNGGPGHDNAGDRAGVHCRTVEDAVRVLDSVKGFEPHDMFTAIPKPLIPKEPFATYLVADKDVRTKPLKGMRIGVVREFMVKHTKNDEAISDQLDQEIKEVLRDKLGAELVESVDPLYPDDPAVPNMRYTFTDAFAEVLPNTTPEYFWQADGSGQLEFRVPGHDVRTVDYLLALARGEAPLSTRINLRRISRNLGDPRSRFAMDKYLHERGDARVKDWASFVANAKWSDDSRRAGGENAIARSDARPDPGLPGYMKMQAVLRMVVLKVMNENGIDAFVNPEQTTPPYKLGDASEPTINDREANGCCLGFTALLGAPEIDVPAGYTRITYDPRFVLSADRKRYDAVTGTIASQLPHPMPISLMVWAGPGSEPAVIKTASAYEAATHHRVPPPAFGPLPSVAGTRVRNQR